MLLCGPQQALVVRTRERHLESIIQSTLRQIVLVHNFPRTLIQVILQITSTPENDNAGSKLVQASSNLPILPALLQTSILALLSASMPLSMILTSTFVALTSNGSSRTIIHNPTISQTQIADSIHVLAFTSHGDLLVAESEGSFTMDDWSEVFEAGKAECCNNSNDDEIMQHEGLDQAPQSISMFVKSAFQEKISKDLHWK